MADTIRGVRWHLEKTKDTSQTLNGFLSWPWRVGFPGEHEWLINLLQEIVRSNKLRPLLQVNFEITQPLWFGLWIRSPLNRLQSSILLDLLLKMGVEVRETILSELEQRHRAHPDKFPANELILYKEIHDDDHRNLVEFLSGLKIAISHDIPMHVSLAPHGHADLGFVTTFFHCPHCKADPPMEKLEDMEVNCPTCGTTYNPRETYSVEKDSLAEIILKELESKNKK